MDEFLRKLTSGLEVTKFGKWSRGGQRRVVFFEQMEAGKRLFWQKPGQRTRRDTESSINVRSCAVCVLVFGGTAVGVVGLTEVFASLKQLRDLERVERGMTTPLLLKKGKKGKEHLYLSLVCEGAEGLCCNVSLVWPTKRLPVSPPTQIARSRNLDFEMATREERDSTARGFEELLRMFK